MITLTAARQVARRARQYGYFAEGNAVYSAITVRCPQCLRTIRTEPDWRHGQTRLQALDAAVIAHLRSPHDDERCPNEAGSPARPI